MRRLGVSLQAGRFMLDLPTQIVQFEAQEKMIADVFYLASTVRQLT